jgi:hypothetical protein
MMLYIGQIAGIIITGTSHKQKIFQFLLLFVNIRNPTKGIKVKAGILVNMDSPKKAPERDADKIVVRHTFPPVTILLVCTGLRVYRENNIEDRRRGSRRLSSNILLKIHVMGITANKIAEINAMVLLLYLTLAIL